jgi:hypothetical protein
MRAARHVHSMAIIIARDFGRRILCSRTSLAIARKAAVAGRNNLHARRWNEHDPYEIWKGVEECMVMALAVSTDPGVRVRVRVCV